MKRPDLLAVAVLTIFLGLALNSYLTLRATDGASDRQVEGCKSVNSLRQAVYDNSVFGAELRVATARKTTGAPRREALVVAARQREDAAALLEAVEPHPLHPGSPKKDCSAAYN